MSAAELLRAALENLARRKLRTLLTLAGVVIGVAALVLMVSLGLGLQRQVVGLFETEESLRTLTVRRTRSDGPRGKGPAGAFPFSLDADMLPVTDEDLKILRAIPGVRSAFPDLNMILRIAFEGRKPSIYPVDGVPPEEEAHIRKALVAGRLWSGPGSHECLIPTAFLDLRLEGARPPDVIGKKVSFGALMKAESEGEAPDDAEVVGVVDTEQLGFQARQIFIPMERALDLYARKGTTPFLGTAPGRYLAAEVKVEEPRRASEVAARVRSSGFTTLSASDIVKQINLIFLILEGFMASVGVIGLVVSLFGIANTMAMAVLERTREIGIMKAVGASQRVLFRLFLAEAALLGLLGGLVGLAAGAGAGWILDAAAHALSELPTKVRLFAVPAWLSLGSVGFATLVSAVAGALPAVRASRMDPVAALRYE
jgi:putative ABC transport system permease protein